MKVLQVNYVDSKGGAARAAYRLHKYLPLRDIDSTMIVQSKLSNDTTVIGPKTQVAKGLSLLQPKIDSFILNLYSNTDKTLYSPAIAPNNLVHAINKTNTDIVHLHWINGGFIRIEVLKNINKPVIWTMHDLWPFSGGCHYPFECTKYKNKCGSCPILHSIKDNDLSRWVWNRKQKSWKSLNLLPVSPSNWLAECARESSLFHNKRIEVIPNGLDLNYFKPIEKNTARESWSLPRDKKLILFGAMNATTDKRKGFHHLKSALHKLALSNLRNHIELIVFGASAPSDAFDLGFKVNYLGQLHDDVSLCLLYSAADVFVAPSIQENFSNTVVEALACGTPTVAFNIGGMPDMIEHKINGYLAEAFVPEDLAAGIEWILGDKTRCQELSKAARAKTEKELSIILMAERYKKLYHEVLSQKQG